VLNVPAHWRIKPSFADLSPFGAGESGRPLRIILDSQTTRPGPALDLLNAFSGHGHVELYATDPTAPGRIEFGEEIQERDYQAVSYVQAGAPIRGHALRAARSMRSRARLLAAEHGLNEQETWQALALLHSGRRHEIDAVVSSAAVLSQPTLAEHARKAHVITVEQACALLGLFLRAHNDFTVAMRGETGEFLTHKNFYRTAVVAALPDFDDSLRATWAIWHEQQKAKPFILLRAVETRMGRALIARDYVNVRIRHWRPDETWDEVLYFFESLLLSLGGALDALARLLDATTELESNPRQVGIRSNKWRKQIILKAPTLTDLLAEDSHFRSVVDLIATLRNFIHGEALSAEQMNDDGEPHVMDYGPGVLVMSGKTAEQLSKAASQVDGTTAWGIEEHHGDATTVMPIQFQHQAVRHVLQAIREAIATDVVTANAPELTVAYDRRLWLASAEYDVNLRLLLGITDGSPPAARSEQAGI
jgi:hypothetical protein